MASSRPSVFLSSTAPSTSDLARKQVTNALASRLNELSAHTKELNSLSNEAAAQSLGIRALGGMQAAWFAAASKVLAEPVEDKS